jgi:hypothetical protein
MSNTNKCGCLKTKDSSIVVDQPRTKKRWDRLLNPEGKAQPSSTPRSVAPVSWQGDPVHSRRNEYSESSGREIVGNSHKYQHFKI